MHPSSPLSFFPRKRNFHHFSIAMFMFAMSRFKAFQHFFHFSCFTRLKKVLKRIQRNLPHECLLRSCLSLSLTPLYHFTFLLIYLSHPYTTLLPLHPLQQHARIGGRQRHSGVHVPPVQVRERHALTYAVHYVLNRLLICK